MHIALYNVALFADISLVNFLLLHTPQVQCHPTPAGNGMSLGSPVPTCKKHLKHLPHSIRNQIRQQHCSGICGVSLHGSTRTFRVKTVRPEEGHLPSCLEKELQNPQSGETNENKHLALAALAGLWSFNCQLMSCPVQISKNERMTNICPTQGGQQSSRERWRQRPHLPLQAFAGSLARAASQRRASKR